MSEISETKKVNADDSHDEIGEKFSGVLNTLGSFRQQITMLQNQVRSLEKTVNRKMRNLVKEAKKNRNKGNRKPSGFAVPTKISADLCNFMGKKKGSYLALLTSLQRVSPQTWS